MQLFYYKSAEGNFGDELNSWLWADLFQKPFQNEDETLFIGVGTILNSNLPHKQKNIVLGSGVGYRPFVGDVADGSWLVHCVRGPLSAQVLKLDAHQAVTDSALLIRSFYDVVPPEKRKGIVFIPHISTTKGGHWAEVCQKAGVIYIDPRTDSKKVIEAISQAELVIADAMHAAIFADAMRVPWVPVVTTVEINSFKWLDWTLSLQLAYKPTLLPQSSLREWVKNTFFFLGGEVQTLFLNTLDENKQFHLPKNAQKIALDDYTHRVSATPTGIKAIVQKWASRLYRRIVNPFLSCAFMQKLCAPLDALFVNKAAVALQQVAQQQSSLSTDALCAQKLQQLRGFVEDINKNNS